MSTHTPGPWEFGGMNTRHVYGPDGHVVCTLAAYQESFFAREHKDTIRANARLIAAAPELLAALQAIMAEPSDIEYHGGQRTRPGCKLCAAMNNARYAIAKATA